MSVKRAIDIILYIDHCIRSKSARSPKEMAEKIGISERQLYKYLRLMKKMGAPIEYKRNIRMYKYRENGSFFIGFLNKYKTLINN
jgi:predicted DNA-binding transcriptional regulator YafY